MNKNLKVMNQRPKASDEEIRSYMNFQSVLNQHDAQIKASKRSAWIRNVIVAVVLVGMVATVWFVRTTKNVSDDQPVVGQKQESLINDNVEEPKQEEHATNDNAATPAKDERVVSASEKKTDVVTERKDPVLPDEKPAEESYVQAEPSSGYPELYDYFSVNLVYPHEALKDSIQGVSTVTFIIDKNGKPGKVEVQNSLGASFDKEARRLIENMPGWKPAMLNGKPVASRISLPITFQYQKIKSKP